MFDEQKLKEFIVAAVLSAFQQFPQAASVTIPEKKYIYSIKELASFLQCSIVTAQKIKNSGRIPYKQEGRKVIFECGEILAAMSVVNGRRTKA